MQLFDESRLGRTWLRQVSPHGARDLLAQLGVWLVFGLAYETVRGAAGHDRVRAVANARRLITVERELNAFFEASLQRGLVAGSALAHALAVSHWLSEYALLVVALVYAYFRRREIYRRFRNAVLIANGLGLAGYLAFPAAPPRFFPADGFRNSLSGQPPPMHPTGLIGFAGNPYAAMPSLHVADAILVAVFLGSLSSSRAAKAGWLLWPCWLAYVVLATGNHFWLDVAAGAVVAAAALALPSVLRRIGGIPGSPRRDRWQARGGKEVAMPEKKPESSLEGNAHTFAVGGRALTAASILLLVPYLRRRREQRKARHSRFTICGH